MFEIVRAVVGLWTVFGMLVVIWFLHREFDRSKTQDWFGIAMSLPIVGWSLWLTGKDLHGLAAVWLWGVGV
jgi:hypothetical protein